MREILLLRHAKSSWASAGVADHDRELAPRGRAAAPRMGRLIRKHRLLPDLVLCSTAVRARQTWEAAGAVLGREIPTRHLRELYLAPPGRMVEMIRRQDEAVVRLLLVGHNPGLHALADWLAGQGDIGLRARLQEAFPTGALAHLRFAVAGWREIDQGRGELLGYWRPRELD